jgi:4-hydroxy-tetrahydrodipicolinate reductase
MTSNGDTDHQVMVAGANGRMGTAMMTGLPHQPGIRVIGGFNRDESPVALLAQADVLVDFTHVDSAPELLLTAIEAGVRPVSGTSGLSDDILAAVDAAARERAIAAVWASNFAPAAALMTHFVRIAAQHMSTAEIIEAHHATKADAPSGTAWELARTMRAARGSDLDDHPSQRETIASVRGGVEGGVRIHSLRLPGVLGWHEVTLSSGDQVLTIRQTDQSREGYVPMVAQAIHEVMRPDRVGLIRGYGAIMGLD